ncbi:MAG: 3-hydroxyacyl-CoA dehydrogenase NAD-binding domain-containing protein [Chloroflexota bacterium]
MTYSIKKSGVVGAGTMGSGIAALLAGVGVPTVLLDIPGKDTTPDDDFKTRNAPALAGVQRLKKSRPPEVYDLADLDLISVGNTEDNLDMLADADWVVEVIIEKLDIKRALFSKLQEVVKPDAILSTNTSGLPIADIAEGMGENFTRRFMGTHFFNPPRYLSLLELIPHEHTDPEAVAYMQRFIGSRMGKGVVIAKDEPNFIGNRFMSMLLGHTVNYAIDNGYTVEEVDSITGPLIGRPKTATFRLSDLVGNDIAAHVGRNLYPAIENDPDRGLLVHEGTTKVYDHLLQNGYLGNKSGQGFYKMVRANGGKEFHPLNLQTMDYDEPTKVRFESVGEHRKVDGTGERIKRMLGEDDRAAEFLKHHFAFYLTYASKRVPEITETIVNVDNAQKWGFAHDMGPFEIWDALGVAVATEQFAAADYAAADWVYAMLDSGKSTFYQRDDNGKVIGYYSPQAADYVAMEDDPRAIRVATLKAENRIVKQNSGANIIDMGDGIALLEMTTPNMTIDQDYVEMGFEAAAMLNSGQFNGLVISHDNERFSIGANLLLVMMAVQSDQLDQLIALVKGLQDFTLALRYADAPVVTAAFNMALGGGTEILMTGDATVAHMELYAGLVEFGVGIIPAGSGTKELMRRALNPVMRTKNADVLPHLQAIFEQTAFAKVSGSAKEAKDMHFLRATDRIIMNRAHLLYEAKRTALYMAEGYVAPQPEKIYAAGRNAYSALLAGIDGLVRGKYASEHDALIARKLAYVMTGGAISEPGWVDEQYVLDLEREAFVELAQTPKTLERIGHMLQTNKPLRN